MSLFRDEVIRDRLDALGVPVAITTGWMRLYAGVAFLAVIGAAIGTAFGSYTRKVTVTGYLYPDRGIIKVMAPRDGRVYERLVEEGDRVAKDQPVFVLDVSGITTAGRTGELVAVQLAQRKRLIRDELGRLPVIHAAAAEHLASTIGSLQNQIENTIREIKARRGYSVLAERALGRNRILESKEVYSEAQREKVEQDLENALAQVAQLERARAKLAGDLEQARADQFALADRQANERSRLERSLAEIEQQIAQMEEQRFLVVRAAEGGTVTRATAYLGSGIDPATPLATIVPDGATLEANLYVPSKAVGFVRVGGRVLLCYEAYPYQKFGVQEATISAVTRTAVSPREMPFPVKSEEPLYLITATLAKQTITAYDREEVLQAGARFDADLMLENRRIWEWILEPLIAINERG